MALLTSFKFKMCLLTTIVLTIILIYKTNINWRKSTFQVLINKGSRLIISQSNTGNRSNIGSVSNTGSLTNTGSLSNTKSPSNTGFPSSTGSHTDNPITLFVRMAGKLPEHRKRFYCDLFRTTVIFWPPSFGKTVLVLDEESEQDHVFAEKVTNQTKEYFPDYKLEVLYESLPKDKSTLDFAGMPKPAGYNRQLWSSFFIDLFSNDSIIAWMDNDAAFITPVTKSSIFTGTKLRVLGTDCSLVDNWVKTWARTTELALGLPYVADFMTYFPVYIYRDTFTHCRDYILNRFNTSDFEEAFRKFYTDCISPVSIVLSYAWYFERGRYDWNLKICTELTEYNKKFPNGHAIGPEHIKNILTEPQTTYHVPYAEFLFSNILVSYCLSHKAAGNNLEICSNHSISLSDNLILFSHDLQRVKTREQTPCTGNNTNACLQVLEHHYNQVGLEIKQHGRKLEWHNVKIVEKLANELDIKCKPLHTQMTP